MSIGIDRTIDIFLSLTIIFVLIWPRFNSWPSSELGKYSGKPKDYINHARFYIFCLVYLLSFCVFIIIFKITYKYINIPSIIQLPPEANKTLKQVTKALGDGSFTFFSLFLCSLLNRPKINEWDEIWRKRLLEAARIPRTVEDLKRYFINHNESFDPDQERFQESIKYITIKLNTDYWENINKGIDAEKEKNSLNWKYLKAQYLLSIIKEKGANCKNPNDIKRRENWLLNIGKEIPSFSKFKTPDIYEQRDKEIDEHIIYFYECICKWIVQQYPKIDERHVILKRFGLVPKYSETGQIRFLEPILLWSFGITFLTISNFTILFYIRDKFGISGPRNEVWLTTERLKTWTIASLICYTISILTGFITHFISREKRTQPNFGIYAISISLSTLGSLVFFAITRQGQSNISYGHMLLALSFGTTSWVIIKSMSDIPNLTHSDALLNAFKISTLFGLIQTVTQIAITIGFSGYFEFSLDIGTIISLTYGFIKGFLLAFILSYTIQETMRIYLLSIYRSDPRKNHLKPLQAIIDGKEIKIVTKNISKSGLLIQSKQLSKEDENKCIKLLFRIKDIQEIKGKIIWKNRKTAGVCFDTDDPNLPILHKYIRQLYGEFYA